MKSMLLSTMVFFAATYSFADAPAPAPAPAPTVVGTWDLTSLECSSGVAVSGGIKVGQDTMKVTFGQDQSFASSSVVAGCDMMAKGTYVVNGNVLTQTITQAQTCKDANPVTMNESKSVYIAYLGDTEGVSVTTGKDAAAVCPAGDALISRYTREVAPPQH